MRTAALSAAAFVLGACAAYSGRVEILARAPSFKARALAIAAVRGAGPRSIDLGRALARRLTRGGMRATLLEDSDSMIGGTALTLDAAADTRLLAEVRRSSGADAVVFLSIDPDWRSMEVTALDAGTGDSVLHATARPAGDKFTSPDDAASAAAEALAELARAPAKAAAAARDAETPDEIPVP